MIATEMPPGVCEPVTVPLDQIEHELNRQLRAVQKRGELPILRASMSNLVIFCESGPGVEAVTAEIPAIVATHPSRVLLCIGEPSAQVANLTASVLVRAHRDDSGRAVCSEQLILHGQGAAIDRLPYAVRGLLIGELPTNLWWAAQQPPALSGSLLYDLADQAQQIIFDSIGWREPARGVAATASWLSQAEQEGGRRRRVVSDLNWRRLKYWRRLLSQALDPTSARGALESITEVLVEHGPHAVVQAWELVSWLASRLGWRVRSGKLQPGVQIDWQFQAPHGNVRVGIRRLAQGPSEIRHLRIGCTLRNKLCGLDLIVQEERRLAVIPEGNEATPRTVTVQPQPLAELVGRQLSDRERDPVYRESMMVAKALAEGLLG
jgi:glucose-6-phosphate dehydrogenase assembly protein OpcA